MILSNGKQIAVGDKASLAQIATELKTRRLADISGDYNPIHLNHEYASKTPFKKCIAHGLFCLGMISNVIGMILPGEGTIFVNERLDYKLPVFMGDRIETKIEITKIIEEKNFVEVDIKCLNQHGDIVMEGTSLLKMLEINNVNN